jgi:peptide-methionine (R)-S-oxide reductase
MEASRRSLILRSVCAGAALLTGVVLPPRRAEAGEKFEIALSDAEWRTRLSGEQYAVLRRGGTESAFSSPLVDEHRVGIFSCAGCSRRLFSSTTKFESGTGWPSFWAPLEGALGTMRDKSHNMVRTEVHCARCGGHLGHVFTDGPKPTGLRYCVNGVALSFLAAA